MPLPGDLEPLTAVLCVTAGIFVWQGLKALVRRGLRARSRLTRLTSRFLPRQRAKLVTVIDGDTYIAVTRRGRHLRIRLADVDCPERGQPFALEATRFVQEATRGQWLDLELRGRDHYGRHLGRIRYRRADGSAAELAADLVSRGLAFVLPQAPGSLRATPGLAAASLLARAQGVGVWSRIGVARPWQAPSRRKWFG